MKNLLVILLLVFVISSCNDDDKKTPVDIFTSTIRFPDNSENWVVAWNSKGELLDYKPGVTNTPTVLSSTGDVSDGKITVAFVHSSNTEPYADLNVEVYTDLPVGQTFTTKTLPTVDNQVDVSKKFNVTLPSTGEYRFLSITNKYGYNAGGGSSTDDFNCEGCYLLKNNSEYNFMYRTDENVRHKLLSGMKENDVINLTEDDFTPYDHEVTYTYPTGTANLILTGFDSSVPVGGPGMLLDLYLSGTFSQKITTGYYGSSFNRFDLVFSSSQGNEHGYLEYEKMGDLPTQFNFPTTDGYSVTNKDPFNLATNSQQSSLFRMAEWGRNTRDGSGTVISHIAWQVYTSSNPAKTGTMPNELMTKFPALTVDASDYENVRFYMGPQTYAEFVARKIEGGTDNFEQTDVALFH